MENGFKKLWKIYWILFIGSVSVLLSTPISKHYPGVYSNMLSKLIRIFRPFENFSMFLRFEFALGSFNPEMNHLICTLRVIKHVKIT